VKQKSTAEEKSYMVAPYGSTAKRRLKISYISIALRLPESPANE